MQFKTVALIVAIAVVAFVALDAFIVYELAEPGSVVGHGILRVLCLAAAAAAAGITASRFNWWREYVGRAWTLLFILYAFITVADALTRFAPDAAEASAVAVILGNIAAVGAFWLFGRALQNAGLQFYGSTAIKVAVFVAAIAIACWLVVPTILSVSASEAGLQRASSLASAVADVITFVLVAPLLLTVWSFRGGQLSWVYGYLGLSTFGWMINQASGHILPARLIRDGRMLGFILACAAVVAAGYLQIVSSRRNTANV